MIRRRRFVGLVAAVAAATTLLAQADEQSVTPPGGRIALTFDDLPVHGPLPPGLTRTQVARQIVDTLVRFRVPQAYGFVNARAITREPGSEEVLRIWRAAGFPLGNHAWSHMDLHANSADAFERDILANEPTLRSYMGDLDWRWFRFPYLREGDTPEKYAAVRAFLAEHRYRVAQVTISFHDYAYNAPYARCAASANREGLKFLEESFLAGAAESLVRGRDAALRTVGRDIDHVMLLHIGAFQTVMLPRLLELLREKQFAIIGLQEAQADKAYETPPRRPGPRLGTFLDQIEIDPPKPAAESGDLFARLNALCADPVQPRSR
jgi:peptidoglycan/xylan/chitin deacetylase (PgdA/CDA1 family)